MSRARSAFGTMLAAAALLALAGCGQRGPLTLPERGAEPDATGAETADETAGATGNETPEEDRETDER